MVEKRKDMFNKEVNVGNYIVFPSTTQSGRRLLLVGFVINIGKKGNPVAEYPIQ